MRSHIFSFLLPTGDERDETPPSSPKKGWKKKNPAMA
jgi:hypothetical protein